MASLTVALLLQLLFVLLPAVLYGKFKPNEDILSPTTMVETLENNFMNYSTLYPQERKQKIVTIRGEKRSPTKICGTWQSNYLKLHHDIITSKKDKKLLIFSSGKGCGGLGDHFVGMQSLFLLSILFNRAFLIEWDTMLNSGAIEPATFDWRLNPKTLAGYPDPTWFDSCPPTGSFESVVLNFLNPGSHPSAFYNAFYECMDRLRNVSIIRIRSNRGFSYISSVREWKWKVRIKELGFRPPYIVGCLLRFLIRIPNWVQEKAEPYLRELIRPGRLTIGIHSRPAHEDTLFESDEGRKFVFQTQTLLDCAQSLTSFWSQEENNTMWFMMSPSTYLKKKFKSKYHDKVILTNVSARHIEASTDAQAMVDVVLEWFIFSHCDFFIFHESGLSASAAMYSMRSHSIFRFDTNGDEQNCDPEVPSSLMDVAAKWSGL